jgi:hypothetical protein
MIVDAILFNDELELLRHRICWLRDCVDVTIVLEADFTFSGRPKSLIAKSKLTELIDLTEGKLIVLQMTDKTFDGNLPDNPWEIEYASREFLVKHLAVNYPGARVLFADLDEIPSLEQMRFISELDLIGNLETFSIPMQVYYRYANWQLLGFGENWNLAKTFNSSFAPAISEIRSSSNFSNLPGKGSHLSYLAMTTQQITNKFEAFSHSELTGFRNIEDFFTGLSDFYFVDHIGHFDVEGRGLIRVLNENQVHDVCEYFIKLDSKYFRYGITPPTLKRLVASALITYTRKYKDSPKGFFHKFVGKSVERNEQDIGIFSSLVILTHGFFMVSVRDMFVFLKQMIPIPIKLSIKKLL